MKENTGSSSTTTSTADKGGQTQKFEVWECKIVVPVDTKFPDAFDSPPRMATIEAVEEAGIEVISCFSGWGGKLDDIEYGIVTKDQEREIELEETTSTNTEDVQSPASLSAPPTSTKDKIIELLSGTGRPGMLVLIDWMDKGGFFEAPASTRFHGAYVGGLAEHSLRVCQLLTGCALNLDLGAVKSAGQKPLPIEKHTIVVAGLLHDVCKIGAYIPTPDGKSPYRWNKGQPKGHARLSIERIKKRIRLEPLEEMLILAHMGVWGLNEFHTNDTEQLAKHGLFSFQLGNGDWVCGANIYLLEVGQDHYADAKLSIAPSLREAIELWKAKNGVKPDWQTGEFNLRGDHSKDDHLTKEESQKARYGQALANIYFHNPLCFWMHVSDMLATAEEKADESKK